MASHQQAPAARDLLYTHGYIARMIGTVQAPAYFTHLLRFDELKFQLVASNDSFFILYPRVQNVHSTTFISNRAAWLLDYMLRDVGTVVPQRLWSPAKSTWDPQFNSTSPLNMPIFFINTDRTVLGLPLDQAASRNCSVLLNAHHPAPAGLSHMTDIRIMWPGYNEWSSQIVTRDQTPAHKTIPIDLLAARVARAVCKRLQDCEGQQCMSPNWFVGQGGITANDIILVGLIYVTPASWQPILQLNRVVLSYPPNTA